MTMIRIGVIGTINKDSVTLADGTRYQGWGGLLYNLIVLSSNLPKNSDIFPACNVGQDSYDELMKILRNIPGVRTDLVHRVPEKNNRCHLVYHDDESKSEVLEGGVPPLGFDDVKGVLECDAVLLNFISGNDIDLKALGKFRTQFGGFLYTDIHSYTLGKKEDGQRYLRVPPDWPTVVEYSDMIQMNREELGLLSRSDIGGLRDQESLKNEISAFVTKLNEAGVNIEGKLLIITDSSRGSYLYYLGKKEPELHFYGVKGRAVSGDTTGCGDCFGAGFLAEFISSANLSKAAEAGNEAARKRILKKYQIV